MGGTTPRSASARQLFDWQRPPRSQSDWQRTPRSQTDWQRTPRSQTEYWQRTPRSYTDSWGTPRSILCTPRKPGVISPSHKLRADELDVASMLGLSSTPLMEIAAPPQGDSHAVTVHAECDTSSAVVTESLPHGTLMHVLETREMADGVKRARVVLKGQVVPLGWLMLQLMDDSPPLLRAAFSRPLYEVVKVAIVRQGCELVSKEIGKLQIGQRLSIVDVRRIDGVQRCCVLLQGDDAPYGWLTMRRPEKGTVTIREVGKDGKVKMPPPDAPAFTSPSSSLAPAPAPPVRSASTPRTPRTPRNPDESQASDRPSSATASRLSAASAGARPSAKPTFSAAITVGRLKPKERGVNEEGSEEGQDSFTQRDDSEEASFRRSPGGLESGLFDRNSSTSKKTSPAQGRAGTATPAVMPANFKPKTSAEILEVARDLEAKAKEAQLQCDAVTQRLSVKLGEELLSRKTKVNELVQSWAKRGVDPINKMEFRQHVKKFMSTVKTYKLEMKEVDALFEELDDDHGGTLDVSELKAALKVLQDAASNASKTAETIDGKLKVLNERAAQANDTATATQAAEQADLNLQESMEMRGIEARLGQLLHSKGLKANDIVTRWKDPKKVGGDGIDLLTFSKNVRGLGLNASDEELGELFTKLDDDGGGTLDHSEIKEALRGLTEAAKVADGKSKKAAKLAVDLKNTASEKQWALKQSIAGDQKVAAAEAERVAQEEKARAAAEEEQKKAAAALAEKKRAAAAAAKAEFEAKVAARLEAARA